MKRGDDQWLLAVRSTIGGSSAAAVLGQDRFRTRSKLWRQMKAARAGIVEREPENFNMRRGRMQEPVALAALAEELNAEIEPWPQGDFVTFPYYPWAHALPDAVLGRETIVEAKVPMPATYARILLDGYPESWLIQCRHNAAVCGVAYAVLAVLNPVTCDLLVHPMEFDHEDGQTAHLMEAEREFFDSLELDVCPYDHDLIDPTWTEARESDVVTLDDPIVADAARRYVDALSIYDDANLLLIDSKQRLADVVGCKENEDGLLIGGPDAFEVPGVVRVTHRVQKGRRMFDKDKAIAEFPALASDEFYKIGTPNRPWRATAL